MENQQSLSSLAERLGSRRDKLRESSKEHRLSKADIGGPIFTDNNAEFGDASEPSGASVGTLRCVIIQKNERGYGLTVSGDNPVYVQSVKENGAAHMAGVRQGDRIIKVNGTNVAEYNHIEVVKLIKSGSHVALTLVSAAQIQAESNSAVSQGNNASGTATKRPHSALITDTKLHDSKVNTIKKMLEQEREEVERIKEEYARNPNKKLLEDLAVAQKLLQDLEKQLWKAESTKQSLDLPIVQLNAEIHPGGDTTDLEEMDIAAAEKENSFSDGVLVELERPKNSAPSCQKEIMNFEEDDLAETPTPARRDHGPFQDFDTLKTKPAHSAVFLNYVFRHHDPSNLLLVLAVEQIHSASTKEVNKLSELISKTYLAQNAPLKVQIDQGISKSIVDAVQSRASLPEDAIRTVFDPAMQHALKKVKEQLEKYRHQKEIGLSYGDEKILPNMDHNQELKVIEDIVTPLIQELGQMQTGGQDDPSSAKIDALERIITQWTGKKKNKITMRIGSILRSKPPAMVMRQKNSTSMESILDEPSKRMSILGKIKKPKTKDPSGTVMPVIHSARPDPVGGEQGNVNLLINKFQDPGFAGNQSTGAGDAFDGVGSFAKKEQSGSMQRDRKLTTKSNSDPDPIAVQQALSMSTDPHPDFQSSVSSSSSTSGSQSSLSTAAADAMIQNIINAYPELDVESESHWSSATPTDVKKGLDKKECKRQEVINELLHTEKHHVRDLLILNLLFYQKMKSEGCLTQEELFAVFPNLQEILLMHQKFKNALLEVKKKDGFVIKDIVPVLLEAFDGAEGEKFKNACAKYCGNQTAALEFIKEKCKKDPKFNNLIQTAERHPICRRLQLKDLIPVEFQRLTKYPLLLESIIKNTKKKEAEKMKQVQSQCREILRYVNKAVKDAEDYQKIVAIQKNLDSTSLSKANHPVAQEYKNIILTERKLVHQGPLTWRITQTEKKKLVELHCVLFEDIMVLLQKQEEKYVLKCHHTSIAGPSSSKEVKSSLQPPILKLSGVLARVVATDKHAIFVLSNSKFGAQIYDLVASTSREAQEWLRIVSSAAEAAKKKDTSRRNAIMVPETPRSIEIKREVGPLPDVIEGAERIAPLQEQDGVDGVDGDLKIQLHKNYGEVYSLLDIRHRLLARHAGIEPSELDNILEMNLMDSDPDPTALTLDLLSRCRKLFVLLNDSLTLDTDFLQPVAPAVLLPTSEMKEDEGVTYSASEPSFSKLSSSGDLEVANNSSSLSEDATTGDQESETETASSAKPQPEDETDVSLSLQDSAVESSSLAASADQQSTGSLEPHLSDYETASEPDSPSSTDDSIKFLGETADAVPGEEGANTDSASDSEKNAAKAVVTDVDVERPADIDTSNSKAEESEGALSPVSNSEGATDKLVSPISFDAGDLLDFGAHAISPDAMVSSPSLLSPGARGLVGKTNPVNFTKMLQLALGMESQLSRLLASIKAREDKKLRPSGEDAETTPEFDDQQNRNISREGTTLTSELGECANKDSLPGSRSDGASASQDMGEDPPSYDEIVTRR